MRFGKKFLICPILPPMSDLTPFYGTGETPPIKAERLELWSHLGSTCLRGSTSTRIWTRALQPDQKEVSSWGFHRAQIVSGRQTFPLIFLLGAEILTPAKILPYAYILARRQHFVLYTRQYFRRRLYFVYPPIFWVSANIFMRRQYFGYPPIFSWDVNILGIRQ